ncbi:MAG: DUF3808 domain-containing protein [Spirochaetes bacterium]|nr:DUF3808 domain-containing protein [Spirochaetota bacterium]
MNIKQLIIPIYLSLAASAYPYNSTLFLPEKDVKTIRRGINLLYNLKYKESLIQFNSLLPKHESHPAPWFFKAMVYWIKINQMEISKKEEKYFLLLLNASRKRTIQMLSKNSGSSILNFYRAGTFGFLARYHLLKKNWYKTVIYGLKMYRILKQSEKSSIKNQDIYLGLGFFNFYAGKLPPILKSIASFFGIKGNINLGLQQLHNTSVKGRFAVIEAKILLAYIYIYFLRRPQRAMRLINELITKFPDNPAFKIDKVRNYLNIGQNKKALELSKKILHKIKTGKSSKNWKFRVLSQRGKILLAMKKYKKSLYFLNESLKQKIKLPENYLPWVYLRIGMIFDKLGLRKYAIIQYKKVINLSYFGKAQKLAKQRLISPYR